MRKRLSLVLAMLMILSIISVPSVMAADVSAISITENKCFYCGEERKAEPLIVKGTLASDGSEIDLTGDSEITYSSSDEEIFKFEGNKLSSTGKNGMAIISATYGGHTAKIIMTHQPAKTAAEQPIASDVNVSNYTNSAYITSGTPGTPEGGHYDGSAFSNWPNNWTVRLMRKSWAKDHDPANISKNMTERWYDSGYRSFGGWFYDDGVNGHVQGFARVMFSDSTLSHQSGNFQDDYGYGKFADKWVGMNSWMALNGVTLYGSGDSYVNGSSFGGNSTKIKPRTKGWHQMIVSLEKNIDSEYGWSVYSYLDGELIGVKDIVPVEDTTLGSDSNSWAVMEVRCHYEAASQNYMDDMILMGSLEKEIEPTAPTVSRLTIDGIAMESNTLTANAKIEDVNGDKLDEALYLWEASDDGKTWTELSGETAKTLVLTADYIGKYIRVTVTPRSTAEPKVGAPKSSDATDKVIKKMIPPTVKDVAVSGTPDTGKMLTVGYTYEMSADEIPEGATKIAWETASSEDGTYTEVQSGASKTYQIKASDADKYIRAKVTPVDNMGNIGAAVTSTAIKLNPYSEPTAESTYYVALSGSDENEGSMEKPFATIEKARDTISALALPEGGVTVYVRGGEYPVTNTVTFDSKTSGVEGKPITYMAYPGEEVSFIGGKSLDTSKIKKVTDEALLNRLVDEDAKKHLYSLDLGEQGIKMSALAPYGWAQSAYNPNEIYMDDMLLTMARWPNDDLSENLVQGAPYLDEGSDGYNDAKQNIMMTYPDPENRSAKWNIKKGDAYVGGAITHFWADATLRIDNVDAERKIVTSMDPHIYSLIPGASWGQQYRIYFGNIFEEIDKPGESYVDRENNILYFYPVSDVETATMTVSTLQKNMFKFDGASNITFKGINFKETRTTPLNIKSSKNIVIDGAEVLGSSDGGIYIKNSTDCEIKNSRFFNICDYAVRIDGGDRVNLVPSNNVIENNYFHLCSLRSSNPSAILGNDSVGNVIRHNEFDDLRASAIKFTRSNDYIIEYNTFTNSLYFSSDMSAIYYGRDISVLGNVIRYNYFANFTSDCWALVDGYVDGIFWDDGAVAPEVYGNVFYNAGRELSQFRTNGGEISDPRNNIIIEDRNILSYAAYVWGWGTRGYTYKDGDKTVAVNTNLPTFNWLYLMNMGDLMGTAEGSTNPVKGNANTFTDSMKALVWSDTWKEHYKGTLWEKALKLYSKELYDGAKVFYDAKDEYGLLKYLDENLPDVVENRIQNDIHDNALIGVTKVTDAAHHGNGFDNYEQTNINAAKSLFVDYDNENFKLTSDGIDTIKASAPKFEDIPFEKIGRTSTTGGHKPSVKVKADIISGIPAPGSEISAAYDFIDEDGDKEGKTLIYWYVADKLKGDYEIIRGKEGAEFKLTDEYAGRYLKYKVIPYDVNSMRGDEVYSEPIQVRNAGSVDLSKLSAAMKEAREALSSATVGSGSGQYPKTAYDELSNALAEAQAVANDPDVSQYAANNAATKLETATAKFLKQKITAIDMSKIVHLNINPLLADKENWVNPGGLMKFENGSLVIESTGIDLATYKAEKYLNHEFSFNMKFEPEDGIATPWVGIYFRQLATDKKVWDSGNGGVMYAFKKDIMEMQEHVPNGAGGSSAMIETVPNDFLSFGEEHTVTCGIYDTEEEGKGFWQMKVDGNVVYEKSIEFKHFYGEEGYFGFSSTGGKLTISPTEADKTNLEKAISDAEGLTFTAGNKYGEYPAELVESFNKAVANAKAVAAKSDITQYDADKAVSDIEDAIEALNEAVVTTEDVTGNKTINIDSSYPAAEINVGKGANEVKLTFEDNSVIPGIKITAERSIGTVKAEVFEGTKLSGTGNIVAAKELTEPSVSVNNATDIVAIQFAEGSVRSDKAVRIVLPGQASKSLGIIVDGKFSRVKTKLSADSAKAANSELGAGETGFIKDGTDYIVWTKALGELVTYNTATSEGSSEEVTGGGGTAIKNNNGVGNGGFFSSGTTNPNLETEFCFNDIQNHWAKADIMAMYRLGVVSGVSETTFDPDRNITRAEFAALIARALKLKDDASAKFTDVEKGSWYEASVNACAKAEIITGFDGKFRPSDTITRNEMAVVISNAYAYLGNKGGNGGINKFTDKGEVPGWAKASVDVCTTAGLISGMTETTFEGEKTATRAQATSILKRLLDK